MMLTRRAALLGAASLGATLTAGCAGPPTVATGAGNAFAATSGDGDKIASLEREILALGAEVLPEEAAAVARIAVREPLVWARRWDAVDPPLIHNIMVNTGRKPRGLCKDWADDLEARLRREGLISLDLHRAIANADTLLIEHSTVIVSPAGGTMRQGLVLDPWRLGQGRLWFGRVTEDPKYRWVERAQVFAMKRERRARQQR